MGVLVAAMLIATVSSAAAETPTDDGDVAIGLGAAGTAARSSVVTGARDASFSAAGSTGAYHLFTSGVDPSRPVGLIVQFHGDGAYEFENPDAAYSIGGDDGLAAQAAARNMVLLVAETPDRASSTWWRRGAENAEYAAALIEQVGLRSAPVARDRVWLIGYSGGSQFITKFLLPAHAELLAGGGAVLFGGGGAPRGRAAFPTGLAPAFPMHWYTGGEDTGPEYDALSDARRGSAWYAAAGFPATIETPAGVGHGLAGRFGPIVGEQLDAAGSGVAAEGPVPPPDAAPRQDGSVAPPPQVAAPADRVVALTNAWRAEAACPPLTVDAQLTSAAQAHADDMAEGGYFGHDTPEGVGPFERMAAVGHPRGAAENIARGQRTADEAVGDWMRAPGQRDNILDCGLTTIGVGHHPDGSYWVQDFGR